MFHTMQRLIPLGMALGSVVSASSELVFPRQTEAVCPTGLHLMIASGCGIPCVTHGLGRLEDVVDLLMAAFPGSDQYLLPYDNSTYQAKVSTPVMIGNATEFMASCPETPIVFVGYSLGGIIGMNTLCGGISASAVPNVLGAIFYGEETYVGNMPYDFGNCTNNAPEYARANTAACDAFVPAIHSYCDSNDPECCAGGTNNASHFAYPELYDVAAVNFIKSRYATWTPPTYSSTSSSSIASSTIVVSTTVSSSVIVSTTVVSTIASSSVVSSTATITSTGLSTVSSTGVVTVSTTAVSTSTGVITANGTTLTTTGLVTSTGLETLTTTGLSTITTTGTETLTTTGTETSAIVVPVSSPTDSVPASYPASSVPGTTSAAVLPSTSASDLSPSSYETSSAIPVTAILYSSSVYESIYSDAVSQGFASNPTSTAEAASPVSEKPTTAATAATTTGSSAGSGTSSAASSAVTPYTGAASRLSMPGSACFSLIAKVLKTVAAVLLI